MSARGRAAARKDLRAFVQQNVAEEYVRAWQELRDNRDRLINLRTLWTQAYSQHCAAVFDAEEDAAAIDEMQDTRKHVRGLWSTLGIPSKAAQAKIRAIGRWYKALPEAERDVVTQALPATKDALYQAATFEGSDLPRLLATKGIGPETTTAQFREALGKATPQDRVRNAKPRHAGRAAEAPPRALHRITVLCESVEALAALVEFTQDSSHSYAIETSSPEDGVFSSAPARREGR